MKNKAEEHHSEIIDSLEVKEPILEEYIHDGSTDDYVDYINNMKVYVEYIKGTNKIESEMFSVAQEEDKETIKKLKDYLRSLRDGLIVDGYSVQVLDALLNE